MSTLPHIFITATGTEVGKTYVSALLVKALREQGIDAGYFKPALSDAYFKNGRLIPGDAAYVCEVAGIEEEPCNLVSHIYTTPVSPHLAARQEDTASVSIVKIMQDFERHAEKHDMLVIEGCGGIVCPLSEDPSLMLSDVMQKIGAPLLIVSDSSVGSINSCVLTIEYARQHHLHIVGVLMNNYDAQSILHSDNAFQIEKLTGIEVLGTVSSGASIINFDEGLNAFLKSVQAI